MGVLLKTRLGCVKNENSGLTDWTDCFVSEADEVVAAPVLLPVGKVMAGTDGVPLVLPVPVVVVEDCDGDGVELGWQAGSRRLDRRPQFLDEVGVGVGS